ncbi:hypothetical protein H9P43_009038 [Blastocladiella emersonii ATCC 22665]|nr:hypothetical protein H9P43_009038 [Blastocladiella emersonii ATCC 22665]
MDAASARGAVGVLDKWRSSDLPLVYSSAVLRDANMSSLEALEWWAASGLPIQLPDYNSCRSLREHYTLQSPSNQHCSLAAIAQLNAAMASPDQALRSFKLKQCTLDIPRLLEFRFPDSLTHLKWTQGWTSRRVDPKQFDEYGCFSLLTRGITDMRLRGCQLEDDAFAILLPHLPPALVSLDLQANSLTATQLSAAYHHLPPTLRSLNLCNTDIFRAAVPGDDEDEFDTSLLGWTLPAGLEVLKMGLCSGPCSKRERASKHRAIPRPKLAALLAASIPPNLVFLHLTNVELRDAPHQP